MSTAVEIIGTSSDGYMYARTDAHFSIARDAEDAYYKADAVDTLRVGLSYPNLANDKY